MLTTSNVLAQQNDQQPTGSVFSSRPVINRALSLKETIEIALKESPVIRGAEEEVNMAIAQVNMARAGAAPILSTTTFLTTGSMSSIFSTPSPVMPQNIFAVPRSNFYDLNLTFMYPLYTGGRLKALIRQAQTAKQASEADLQAMRRDLVLEVKTAYRQVLLAQAMQRVAEQRQQATDERLRIDRVAFDEGRIPKLYVLRDEAEHADANQMFTNAKRDVEMSLVMLRTVMGVSPDSQITLSDTLNYEPLNVQSWLSANLEPTSATPNQPQPNIATLLALAEKNRPELMAARQRVETAQSGIAVAKSAYKPQLSLMAMADSMKAKGMERLTGASFGVIIGLPILDGGMRKAAVNEATAQMRKAQQDYEKVALQVIRDVQTAWLALQAAEQNIKTAEAAIAAAEEDYRVVQMRYESGRGINVEVLDTLTALTRARTNRAQALFDYNLAADQLLRAVGQ